MKLGSFGIVDSLLEIVRVKLPAANLEGWRT